MSGFCPQCGKPREDGQAFCSNCGNRVENYGPEGGYAPAQPPQYVPPAQAAYAQPPYYPQPKKKTNLIVILSVVFLLLAGAAVALIFILGPYDAKPGELNGEWDVTLKMERILNEDAGYATEEDAGDEREAQMLLNLDKDGEGEAAINGLEFDAAYNGGKIAAKGMMNDELQISLNGTLKKEKEALVFTGTWEYTLVKGKDKGAVAQGSWRAVLVEPGEENASAATATQDIQSQDIPAVQEETARPPSGETTIPNTGISAADLEGTWKGEIVMEAILGLDENPNIPDEDKEFMKEEIGKGYELVLVVQNGKLWLGDEYDAESITEDDMGALTISGTSFSGTVGSDDGFMNLTGKLVNEGGRQLIQCRIVIPDVPAYNSNTETVTVEASFRGEKQ